MGKLGHRKRVAAYEAAQAASASSTGSHLGKLLIQQYCWGFMSAIVLQQFAAAAVADGATHDDLKRLLGGGSSELPTSTFRSVFPGGKPAPS